MFNEVKKIGVFVKRDFRMLYTYKLAFLTTFLNMIITFFHLALFGGMFGISQLSSLSIYGGDFISYILVGSIGWGFLWNILNSTSFSLRNEMMMGTLESLLITPTRIYTMMVSYAIYGSFFGVLSMIILFIIGVGVYGFTAFSNANIYTIIIFCLSAAMMMGIGMIFAGLTLWFKHIGQTLPLIQGLTLFFSGVYFPVDQLPPALQPIVNIMPFYYSVEGLRLSLLPIIPIQKITNFILILLVMTILSIIIGIIVLNKGVMKAKKDGSLGFY